MSKTRTGRKGRARLAIAGHLNAVGGTKTSLDTANDATLLEKLRALSTGQGTSGELFSQRESRGALVDSDCSGSGIYAGTENAGTHPLAANVAGETTLAASGDLPQLQDAFTHHYMIKQGTTGDIDAAIAASKVGDSHATTTSGIAYLASGAGAKFIPANHGLAQNDVISFSVTPDYDTVKKSSYTKMSYVLLGDVTGHTLVGKLTQHVQPFAKFDVDNFGSFDAGDEIRINGKTADGALVKLIAAADGSNGIDVGNGINHVVSGSTVYILQGTTGNNETAAVIGAAINAWAAANDNNLSAAVASDEVTVTLLKYKGADGNNAVDSVTSPLTITAYKQQTIRGEVVKLPLDPTVGVAQQWFTIADDADTSYVKFAGGVTASTPFKDSGNDVAFAINGTTKFLQEGNKYLTTDMEVTLTIGADVTTAQKGLALAWSLS